MMELYNGQVIDLSKHKVYRSGHDMSYSDTIYCFDIETTSMFYIDGEWREFDYSISDYKDIKKAVCPYICMFGVEDKVYYWREMEQFEEVLKSISNQSLTKIIYVHNLAYEFEFLQPILKKYTVNNMIARQARKPISFRIEELNIEFRCSMMLTNMGLARSAERYTNVQKKVGDLDYSKLRSPLTSMSEVELGYCEYDIVCMYEILKYFRKQYEHIKSIPLTQTGELRREFSKRVPREHYKLVNGMLPNLFTMKSLMYAFAGGITHGNALFVKQYLEGVGSKDKSSSYPYSLCAFKYPMEAFKMVKKEDFNKYNHEDWAKIIYVEMWGIRSRLYNHYISRHKCLKLEKDVIDNGRVVSADYCLMCVTDVDFDLIMSSYEVKRWNCIDLQVARKDYLPSYFIDFILQLYEDKTTLKGVEGKEDFYMKQKQMLNGQFGACCTNIIKNNVVYDSGKWYSPILSDNLIKDKLDEMYRKKNLYVYAWGVWCTAYSRKELWTPIVECKSFVDETGVCVNDLDFNVVYYDTDSLKLLDSHKYDWYFEKKNKEMDRRLLRMCMERGIDFNRTRPKDMYGHKHPLGYWENDGEYTEFVTLGSKRYCYRDKKDGKLHITVSGVGKSAVKSLGDDIHNFNVNTFFGYKDAGKLLSVYIDSQDEFTFKDCEGKEYTCKWGSGIVLMPTTYSMSMDDYFEVLLEQFNNERFQSLEYDKILEKVNQKKKRRNGRLLNGRKKR